MGIVTAFGGGGSGGGGGGGGGAGGFYDLLEVVETLCAFPP